MRDLLSLLLLLGIANGAPVLAAKLFGQRFNTPVDVGCKFVDGRPLFGASKTIRGIVFSLLATSLAAPMLGFAWTAGALLAAGAMVGDLAQLSQASHGAPNPCAGDWPGSNSGSRPASPTPPRRPST